MSRLIFSTQLGAAVYRLITENRFWFREVESLARHLHDLPPGARVLDLGCGPGTGTLRLAGRLRPDVEVVGVDISAPMLAAARRHAARTPRTGAVVRFEQADGETLPFDTDSFDAVVGHSVLYLVPRPERALREARRVCHPDGIVAFMEPAREGNLLRAAWAALPHLGEAVRAPLSALAFVFAMTHWRMLAFLTRASVSRTQAERWSVAADLGPVVLLPRMGSLGWHLVWRRPTPASSPAAGLLAVAVSQR